MANSKIIYDGQVLIDLTGDTVEESKLLEGVTAHGPDGEPVTGTCTYDVDSSGATAKPAEVLTGKTFAAGGEVKTGTMVNKGSVSGSISTKDGQYTIPQGYHDGGGKVGIAPAEQQKLIPGNIKKGVSVLGVTGGLEPSSDVTVHSKTVTPAAEQQIVTPDVGYDYLAQVTVEAIPYSEAPNSAGGVTVTIG